MAEVDVFNSPEFFCLSNFASGYGFWAEGTVPLQRQWWPSAEHYFQAGKFLEPKLQDEVRRAEEPGIAKHMGRTLGPLREDWEECKRERLRQAMLEKLWRHQEVRETLLRIPAGARIVNGNSSDGYFGTGPDGRGHNVIGQELQSLRALFATFPKRRQLLLKVGAVGEPLEPRSVFVDLTGIAPDRVADVAARTLRVRSEDLVDVQFLTDDGFERVSAENFQTVDELEAFLASSEGDCELEVHLAEVAVVTLWNSADESFLARADVRHMCQTREALLQRLESLAPLLRHKAFAPRATFTIDGSEPAELDDASMASIVTAAQEMADVLICAHYDAPENPQPPLRPAPSVSGSPQVASGRHTDLAASTLVDRLRGLIWGAALGDAVGLATEFMKKSDAAEAYPEPSKLSPASRLEDKHRARWAKGDWTDDTDQLVLLLDAIVAGEGVFDSHLFARSLKCWRSDGFPELGDTCGLGIGQTVNGVLEHPAYDVAPDIAADAVWRQSGCTMAANGAVMRCAIAAAARFWDEEVVTYNAAASAAVTHADPRCVASCVAIASIAARVLTGVDMSTLKRRQEEVSTIALQVRPHLDGGDTDELMQHMAVNEDGLEGLHLGSGGIGYTYKPLAAACWAFLHAENFKDAIQAITMEAGDADSNATVAGALLGVRLGFSQLPQDWLREIPAGQTEWMTRKIGALLHLLGLESES